MISRARAHARAHKGRSIRTPTIGHLGVQFANKLGFRTVAIARGADKGVLARKLGAHHFIGKLCARHFIDSATEDVAARLNRLGGARAVLATVTSAEAMRPANPANGPGHKPLLPSRGRMPRGRLTGGFVYISLTIGELVIGLVGH